MHEIVKRVGHSSFVRYVVVGALSIAIDYGFLLFLYRVMGMPLVVATPVAFLMALGVNFLLQQRWAFQASHARRQPVLFGLLVVANLVFTTLFITMLAGVHIGPEISKLAATALITAWNFILFKKVIFK